MSIVQRVCHYCMARATTRDHIVPRFLVRELSRLVNVETMHGLNLVPCCDLCNQLKGRDRGWCFCDRCTWAWDFYDIMRSVADGRRRRLQAVA